MAISLIVKNCTRLLLVIGVVAVSAAAAWAPLLWAQQSRGTTASEAGENSRNGRQAALRDQLMIGLKARTKADRAFVERVVLSVEEGYLPRKLVDSTFLWARKRAADRRGSHKLRAMVYFRPALIRRAEQLGYSIVEHG